MNSHDQPPTGEGELTAETGAEESRPELNEWELTGRPRASQRQNSAVGWVLFVMVVLVAVTVMILLELRR